MTEIISKKIFDQIEVIEKCVTELERLNEPKWDCMNALPIKFIRDAINNIKQNVVPDYSDDSSLSEAEFGADNSRTESNIVQIHNDEPISYASPSNMSTTMEGVNDNPTPTSTFDSLNDQASPAKVSNTEPELANLQAKTDTNSDRKATALMSPPLTRARKRVLTSKQKSKRLVVTPKVQSKSKCKQCSKQNRSNVIHKCKNTPSLRKRNLTDLHFL